jgi:hypothetical protein
MANLDNSGLLILFKPPVEISRPSLLTNRGEFRHGADRARRFAWHPSSPNIGIECDTNAALDDPDNESCPGRAISRVEEPRPWVMPDCAGDNRKGEWPWSCVAAA